MEGLKKPDDEESNKADTSNWKLMGMNNNSSGNNNNSGFSLTACFDTSNEARIGNFATSISWAVNWFLLLVKAIAVVLSASKAVAAALADSAVDLMSQFILSLAERYMHKHNPNYPVGRSRLEALSVLGCACIMTMASVEVIQYSVIDVYSGLTGHIPKLNVDAALYTILGVGIFMKLFLYMYCKWVHGITGSDTLEALAEDHLNDVFSNIGAVATAAIAANTRFWWFDPAGAIIISVVIIYRWVTIMSEQVKKIVGHTAPPEFIEQVEKIAHEHDPRLVVDCTRAYHFGARFNVEMEIVLPGDMTVMESHDIALALQHKIEGLDDVERAFVHVDHDKRDGLEHKVERKLIKGTVDLTTPGSPTSVSTPTEIRQRRPYAAGEEIPL